jgi:hypothetical protein
MDHNARRAKFDNYRSLDNDERKRRNVPATLHRRGPGALATRMVSTGTLEEMVKRFVGEPLGYRSELTLMQAELQYKPAEVANLARQFGIS